MYLPYFNTDAAEILKEAVKCMQAEQSIKSQALATLSTASNFLEWAESSDNQAYVSTFARNLVKALMNCIPKKSAKNPRTQRDKMWSNFHSLRVSHSFKKLWHDFLDMCGQENHPLFFQRVSDLVFEKIIADEFRTVMTPDGHVRQR